MKQPQTNVQGFVYILKLSEPLGNRNHQAIFYVGFAINLEGRLWHHRNGTGAAFTRAAVERGITMDIIFSMPGTRADERRIKNRKSTRRFLQSQGIAI